MAITKGVNIGCSDLQSSGGIRNILIRSCVTGDAVTYTNSATAHAVSSIVDTGGSTATWHNYEFKNEIPTLTVTAARENGSTSYEATLTFMMPEMDSAKGAAIQALMDTCMMAIAVGNNGKQYVLGLSQKYENEGVDPLRNQTYLSMTGVEGVSGAGVNDDNGYTVTLACKQWEALREYTGTLTLYSASNPGESTTS
jgi:hypothetical protein|tara:strand:+ start:1330 stop:1920 length:591 start_codon:yes stop_codon:yes gene_type:complete